MLERMVSELELVLELERVVSELELVLAHVVSERLWVVDEQPQMVSELVQVVSEQPQVLEQVHVV